MFWREASEYFKHLKSSNSKSSSGGAISCHWYERIPRIMASGAQVTRLRTSSVQRSCEWAFLVPCWQLGSLALWYPSLSSPLLLYRFCSKIPNAQVQNTESLQQSHLSYISGEKNEKLNHCTSVANTISLNSCQQNPVLLTVKILRSICVIKHHCVITASKFWLHNNSYYMIFIES